ncbi:hypothetical protein [Agitococcus lubricus]|uniref:Acetyltransferase (GNAT) family protein n=1 Tax=Agitococcus lubricus TaxID=1077255 RepID=A0A2T5J0U0_9GAMM|nr:hypothetical protein [Agitococcus lubricus]PTQ90012.1 hypothetical protein C8N29_10450 [Agitococcus lubricus]
MKAQTNTPKLNAKYYPLHKIDVHDIRQMYGIYSQYYENTSWDIFLRDLSKKTGAFILTCPKEQRIVGFSTIVTSDLMVKGEKARAVFSGDTIIERAYWGSRALQVAFYKFVVLEKARHPRQTLYWLLISKGFKTYLLLANNFTTYYPNPSNTHGYLADVVDDYCQQMFADYYDAEKRVLDFGHDYQCLKGDVAEIDDTLRHQNRKIRFFEECNPEWRRGTELPCVGVLDLENLGKYVLKYLSKASSKGRRDALNVEPQTTSRAEVHPLRAPVLVSPIQRRA